ncbi:stage V sporulation protein AE [Brevibacillus humidisoli]|uniref:stage V sporulation protein AE n=1 Tax=Brevibacillus humidisoli TaxID=2895522 RepID=UPI001E35ED14|nr:stage V sporulation protein AE [Brevibacillus humidisoli]UFJ42847.1 stage V sporulation protein AE [Brevibacillus humidisoli]
MGEKSRKVILITDGDHVAQRAIETVAKQVGGRCISLSAGNPTPLSGSQVVELIKQAAADPVLVMFDDNGNYGRGLGEQAIEYVMLHPDVEVLGVIAVASNTRWVHGTSVKYSVDNKGNIIEEAVDKDGNPAKHLENRIYGDTVDILNKYRIPCVIGIGDIGKMQGKDSVRRGCPVTRKAVEWILERSEWGGKHDKPAGEQRRGESTHIDQRG